DSLENTMSRTSWLKKGLSALLQPAEDPRQTAVYLPQRQQELLRYVQAALVDIAQMRAGLVGKTAVMQTRLPSLEEQARAALAAGHEEKARLALHQRQITAIELQTMAGQLQAIAQKEQQLQAVEQHLVAQIEAYVARQEAMAARYQTASSQIQVNRAIQDIFHDLADLGEAIATAESHTEHLEARADWLDGALRDELLAGTAVSLTGDYVGLETAVEVELAHLKTAIRYQPPAGAKVDQVPQ
ncbi:MAG TPA: hypothetical protein PLK31_06305, partial [Chloroflexota bacterium]|nr:hypothetical protein [Chloroflexota bacterium]